MKSNFLFRSFLTFLLVMSQSLIAQDQIVMKKGDTLRVYIIKSFKATNAKKLSYKIAAESTSEEVLLPSQVKSLVAGGTYESVLITPESGESQYLFLQKVIEKGKIQLYKGVDEDGNPDFFIQKESKVLPVDKINLTVFIEKHFLDCPSFEKEKYLPAKIENYRQDYLMDLVSYYNNCSEPQTYSYVHYYSFPKPKKKDELHFGVKLGGGLQQYAYRSFASTATLGLYGEGVFNPQASILAGIYGKVQYSQSFSIYLELSYLYRNAKSIDGAIDVRFSGLNIPFVLELSFLNKKKNHPFLNAGLNTVIGIGSNYLITPPSGFQILRPLSMSPVSFGGLVGGGMYIATKNRPIKIEGRFIYDFFEVNNISVGSDKMRNANFMIVASYPIL